MLDEETESDGVGGKKTPNPPKNSASKTRTAKKPKLPQNLVRKIQTSKNKEEHTMNQKSTPKETSKTGGGNKKQKQKKNKYFKG